MFKPPWYGDMRTGDRVLMKYVKPPLASESGRAHLAETVTVEGALDRLSMDPVEGYPWNATPHAVSVAVVTEEGEHRAPLTKIVDLHPLIEAATVEPTQEDR